MQKFYALFGKPILVVALLFTSAFTIKSDRTQAPANVPHAVIYFYQSRLVMTYFKYDIKHNDEILATSHAQWRQPVVVFEEGPMELSATTEVTRKLKLDIQMGESYYVSCENGAGLVVPSPRMKLESESAGIKNYNKSKTTNKFSYDVIVMEDGTVEQVKLDENTSDKTISGMYFDSKNPESPSEPFSVDRSKVAAVYAFRENL